MKKLICIALAIVMLASVTVFADGEDEPSYPEWLINSDYTEEEKEYIVSMIAPGWLEHFAFDEEGIVKAIQKRADYFGTTFEEMKAYLQDEAEMRDATIGYEIEDGSVAVVPNRYITVNLAPGFCDYYAELDPEEVFPGIEIEEVFYLNSRRLSSDRTYPRDYNPELYAMTVELKLKNGGIDVLNDALEKLYSLDYVKDAFMGRHILGIKPDIPLS